MTPDSRGVSTNLPDVSELTALLPTVTSARDKGQSSDAVLLGAQSTPEAVRSVTLERLERVLISLASNDKQTLLLAGYAQGVVARALHDRKRDNVVVKVLTSKNLRPRFIEMHQSSLSATTHLVVCVNSKADPKGARETLSAVRLNTLRSAVVLDLGFSRAVQELAKQRHLYYEPNVMTSAETSWVETTIRGQERSVL